MKPLFCYGSNNPDQVIERLGLRGNRKKQFLDDVKPAYLPKHGRVFRGMSRNWGGGTATVVKDNSRTVYGYVCYLTPQEFNIMDRREGALMRNPTYKRSSKMVHVFEDGSAVVRRVQIYLSTSKQFNAPTRDYVKAIVKMLNSFWKGSGNSRVKISDIPIK